MNISNLNDEQRKRALDILVERSLEGKRGIEFDKPKNVPELVIAMNIRLKQYTEMFPDKLDNLILQVLHDFIKHLEILQKKEIVKSEPIARLYDESLLYIDRFVLLEDIKEQVLPKVFTLEEPYKGE